MKPAISYYATHPAVKRSTALQNTFLCQTHDRLKGFFERLQRANLKTVKHKLTHAQYTSAC